VAHRGKIGKLEMKIDEKQRKKREIRQKKQKKPIRNVNHCTLGYPRSKKNSSFICS
jgi:U3 small nucleolar ribonucleoprotein component